ncbi:phosphatase PAP2 family protein [Pedococcus sp. KACC 23699]|uniref:Phosphatase PAP2 family protein n=1 Tax=Pedococcus sp. KACC 23699 TaxID=3149228 RepID=A0AAU7JWS9_9MICO
MWVAMGAFCCFVALGVLVATGASQASEAGVISELRPHDAWGPAQVRWSPWMSRLRPERMYLVLTVTTLAASAWRRSARPAIFATTLAGTSVVLTLVSKLALDRPDPHGFVTGSGGSYPSGHMVAVLVCLAGCQMILWPRVRWWGWLPVALAGTLMAVALLVSAAHWPTDVLGGGLLSFAIVAAASSLRLRQRAFVGGGSSAPPSK